MLSPIWAITSGNDGSSGLRELSLEDAIQEVEQDPEAHPVAYPHQGEREFVVPLTSDLAFFNLLTSALSSLSTFHAKQQTLFRQSVFKLCSSITKSIQPNPSEGPVSNAITRPSNTLRRSSARTSQRDLYVWRQIFTLWIEAEIFESSAERTRGERSIQHAETRLRAFASEVVKRGLGDRRTIKGKGTREAWEEFLRLNVLLLDLKRFQVANVNAVRK